ncbi:MAG: 2OG-Fe(II) oxygenase family protein [Pseudomonadota bacterium]
MFSKCEVNHYFPTCVWVHEIANHPAINDQLERELHGLRAAGKGHGGTERAWRSDGDLHQLEGFRPLTQILVAASKGVLDFLKCRYQGFDITNCWANINRRGEAHHLHSHPNNFLSGVYYVRAPEGCGDIVFHDPRQQAIVLLPAVAEYTPFNSSRQRVAPKAGTLLVFPSWFQHLVEENTSDAERISISFNVMLRGSVGQQSGGANF